MIELPECVDDFIAANDFSRMTVNAIRSDLRKFIAWFVSANDERFDPTRVTVRDVADFRDHLSRVRRQAVATTNRALVSIRRFLGHLVASGALSGNPAKSVKELRRMPERAMPHGATNQPGSQRQSRNLLRVSPSRSCQAPAKTESVADFKIAQRPASQPRSGARGASPRTHSAWRDQPDGRGDTPDSDEGVPGWASRRRVGGVVEGCLRSDSAPGFSG